MHYLPKNRLLVSDSSQGMEIEKGITQESILTGSISNEVQNKENLQGVEIENKSKSSNLDNEAFNVEMNNNLDIQVDINLQTSHQLIVQNVESDLHIPLMSHTSESRVAEANSRGNSGTSNDLCSNDKYGINMSKSRLTRSKKAQLSFIKEIPTVDELDLDNPIWAQMISQLKPKLRRTRRSGKLKKGNMNVITPVDSTQ